MKKLAIIRFWYEGNAFSPVKASKASFQKREWLCGSQAEEFYRNTNLELGAVDGFLTTFDDIEASYIFCAAAYPAGPMVEGLFTEFCNHVTNGLKTQQWHGVYLSLHGSAVSEDQKQPELALIKQLRSIIGTEIPVAVSFDLHANLCVEMADLVDIICAYKTYPHIDMLETADKALNLLGRTMRGEISPTSTIVPAGFAPTSFNMSTERKPMADLVARAKQLEVDNGLLDVSVYGGFIYADSIDTGASVSICAEVDSSALATELARTFRLKAALFDQQLVDAKIQLDEINQQICTNRFSGPIAILEPSDNIFSGGAGDTPGLLRVAIQATIDAPALFAFFWDPGVVEAANRAGIGQQIDCELGARLSTDFGASVKLTAQVHSLSNGRFSNRGPMEKGLNVNLGPTAVLKNGYLSIIVTSENIPVNDMAYFELHGFNLDNLRHRLCQR